MKGLAIFWAVFLIVISAIMLIYFLLSLIHPLAVPVACGCLFVAVLSKVAYGKEWY